MYIYISMHASLRIYLFSYALDIHVYIYICRNVCACNSRHGEKHACVETHMRAWIYACTSMYTTFTHTFFVGQKNRHTDIRRQYMYVNVHVYSSMYTGIYRCRHWRVDRLCDCVWVIFAFMCLNPHMHRYVHIYTSINTDIFNIHIHTYLF